MSILVEGRRLSAPSPAALWPWWVGPDTLDRWHVTLAPAKPNAESRTLGAAVCGLKPPTRYQCPLRGVWWSWKWQRREPPPGACCCPVCAYEAERHEWPRPTGGGAVAR